MKGILVKTHAAETVTIGSCRGHAGFNLVLLAGLADNHPLQLLCLELRPQLICTQDNGIGDPRRQADPRCRPDGLLCAIKCHRKAAP